MENKYDYDSIQELLNWAKDILKNKEYPSGSFQINQCTIASDCGKYIHAMIAMISNNWENPTFYPTIDQLRELKKKIERSSAK